MDEKYNQGKKIRQIFDTMQYGDETEGINDALEWLKSKEKGIFPYIDSPNENPSGEASTVKNAQNDEILCKIYIPDTVTVETFLKTFNEKKNTWGDLAPITKTDNLQKIGNEIENKLNLFVQLEVVARGLLRKDTKKSLALLTDLFLYYSGFTFKAAAKNSAWKPEGLVVGIVSEENALSVLGYILAPALAAGYKVVLQVPPQLAPATSLLIDVATKVGLPEDTIRLLPGPVEKSTFFINPQVSIVSIFDNLLKEEFFVGNHLDKKLLNHYSPGIPMLVFDHCDLDSACQSVIDAAWGHQGLLPWSIRNILVQENILDQFTQRLKHVISQIKVGTGDKINVDFSLPSNTVLGKVKLAVTNAQEQGIDVFQPNSDTVLPVVLFGGNVFFNNVIKEDSFNIPIVTVTAFRTINEGINLANNTRQGLAASVWTENTSVLNEVAAKLKVSNVWVNSHGLFAANISSTPYKSSGNASFGGAAGFHEYIRLNDLKDESNSKINNGSVMDKTVNEAKSGYNNWNKLAYFEKENVLKKAALKIASSKNLEVKQNWIDDWIQLIFDCVSNAFKPGTSQSIKGYNVVTRLEPRGVLAVETLEEIDSHKKKLIIIALLEGNAIIILNNAKSATAFYTLFGSLLPKGLLSVLEHSQECTRVVALHKEINVYFAEKTSNVFRSLPLKSSSKFQHISNTSWEGLLNKVTLQKNVWCNLGQSFM